MRLYAILIGSTVLLLGGIFAAWPQEVPVLDLNPICRGIAQGAAGAGERGRTGFVFCTLCEKRTSNKKKSGQNLVQICPGR
jgi:hypothetical protein